LSPFTFLMRFEPAVRFGPYRGLPAACVSGSEPERAAIRPSLASGALLSPFADMAVRFLGSGLID
jgi:hypothetical protein